MGYMESDVSSNQVQGYIAVAQYRDIKIGWKNGDGQIIKKRKPVTYFGIRYNENS